MLSIDYLRDFDISHDWLIQIFPFYLLININNRLIDKGPHFSWLSNDIKLGSRLDEHFMPLYSFKELNYEFIKNDPDQDCVLKHNSGLFTLKGKAYFPIENGPFLYLPSIHLDDDKMIEGFSIDDFQPFDQTCDMILLKSIQDTTARKNLILIRKMEDEARELERKVINRTSALLDAKKQAESANLAKSTFLSTMSHEIRTPMNAVLGFAEILRKRETDKQKAYFIDSIHSAGKSLLGLINDVLDISKIEADKMIINYHPVNILPFFEKITSLFTLKSQDKKLDFRIKIDKNIPIAISIDENRLRQILINIIGNAIKFTSEGFIEIRVSSKISIDNQIQLYIDVEDSGIGIAKDQQEKIFEAFEQQKGQSTSVYGGTGLGLAITSRLILLMKGDISVSSELNKGSCFSLIFHDIEVVAPVIEMNLSDDDLGLVKFHNTQVVIADDNTHNREILQEWLSNWNIKCLIAKNGQEALDLVKTNKVDLILMDMKMPVMDGYETSAFLKSHDSTNHIPIVGVTASALKADEELIRKTCDSFIAKPVSEKAILNIMGEFLEYEILDIPAPKELSKTKQADQNVTSELLKALDDGFKYRCIQCIDSMTINGIQNLLDDLLVLSETYPTSIFGEWVDTLQDEFYLFNMHEVKEILQKFEALYSELNK